MSQTHLATTADDTLDPVDRFRAVRQFSEELASQLEPEDCVVQAMDDASPVKWHLAHTTWFFETFLLKPHLPGYVVVDDRFEYLFNSYYNAIGERHPRPKRGLLTRPYLSEVLAYREAIDAAMTEWLATDPDDELMCVFETGLHHEQQHQELILSDAKYLLSQNPLRSAFWKNAPERHAHRTETAAAPLRWIEHEGGMTTIGHVGEGFCYDNEGPRHEAYLHPFAIASRPVTNGEFLAFMEAGGYRDPQWWLSEGWATVNARGWQAPLYWERSGDGWESFTLHGMQPVDEHAPVCHVSLFEADAYARWSGKRLPTEFEWETVCVQNADPEAFPLPMDVWEWTQSPYTPYPGYRPAAGAIGEYNGKFMCNQYVLRGGSLATSDDHIRPTYRNFFPGDSRWQFTGIRLADDR